MTDIDSPEDAADAAATEAALAFALTQALTSATAPGNNPVAYLTSLTNVVEANVELPLRMYVLRELAGFLDAVPGIPDLDIEQVANDAVRAAISSAATNADRIMEREDAPRIEDGEAYRRLRVGMASVSRVLATYAREMAKENLALGLGATGRVWHTMKDERVRVSHYDLEGEFKPVGEPFVTIRDAELMRPGDPTAPLAERVHCRCRLSWRIPA